MTLAEAIAQIEERQKSTHKIAVSRPSLGYEASVHNAIQRLPVYGEVLRILREVEAVEK